MLFALSSVKLFVSQILSYKIHTFRESSTTVVSWPWPHEESFSFKSNVFSSVSSVWMSEQLRTLKQLSVAKIRIWPDTWEHGAKEANWKNWKMAENCRGLVSWVEWRCSGLFWLECWIVWVQDEQMGRWWWCVGRWGNAFCGEEWSEYMELSFEIGDELVESFLGKDRSVKCSPVKTFFSVLIWILRAGNSWHQ